MRATFGAFLLLAACGAADDREASETPPLNESVAAPEGEVVEVGSDSAPLGEGDAPASALPCTEVKESFDGALDATKFALNGVATQVAAPQGGQHIRLTPNTKSQTGSIVFRHRVGEHFTVKFSFFISAPARGGDGMALQLLTGSEPTALGEGGGALGLAPLAGYGVTFDTSKNAERGETDGNHISLVNAADLRASATTTKIPLLDGGTFFDAVVTFDSGDVVVSINDVKLLEGKVPNYVAQPLLVGFSAATGGVTNVHVIDNLEITCRGK